MLVAYMAQDRAVFLYAFAKNERDDIGQDELLSLREIAAQWQAIDLAQITKAIESDELQEVSYDEDGI